MTTIDITTWWDRANCLGMDPEFFFPEKGAPMTATRAVCAACAVREDCLEYALVNAEKFGVWGGTSEKERRAMRKARREAAALEEVA